MAIPVGSLERLRQPDNAIGRKPFSLITASRLAAEKHIDWLVSAVILAKEEVPELTFDKYLLNHNDPSSGCNLALVLLQSLLVILLSILLIYLRKIVLISIIVVLIRLRVSS